MLNGEGIPAPSNQSGYQSALSLKHTRFLQRNPFSHPLSHHTLATHLISIISSGNPS